MKRKKWIFYLSTQVFFLLLGVLMGWPALQVLASIGLVICFAGYANAIGAFDHRP